MIKQLLSCIALACSTLASAQTYFYIDEIAVVPQQPTTSDYININLMQNGFKVRNLAGGMLSRSHAASN